MEKYSIGLLCTLSLLFLLLNHIIIFFLHKYEIVKHSILEHTHIMQNKQKRKKMKTTHTERGSETEIGKMNHIQSGMPTHVRHKS